MRLTIKYRHALGLILFVSFLSHLPALIFPEAKSHSAIYNFIWTIQFADAFADGNYYPRWFADSFEGLGSPTFYFYPPLTFWISGGVATVGIEPLLAAAIAALFFSAASGLAMYHWLRDRTPHALAGAIVYVIAPYHLFDLYVRGALAEYAAFIWPLTCSPDCYHSEVESRTFMIDV